MNIELKLSANLQEAHILVKGLEAMFTAGSLDAESGATTTNTTNHAVPSAEPKTEKPSVITQQPYVSPALNEPPAPPQAAPAVPTAPPAHTYSLAEIQAACAPLMDAGKIPELQGVMQKYGVPSLMQIPKERYGELATDLRALGARL